MSEVPGNAEPQLRINNEWRSRGYLPHRERIGLLQSITFRLADSLPQEKLRELEMVKNAELGLRVPGVDVEKRKRIEVWLNAGMGSCALGHPQMAAVMQDTLLKFDEQKYHLVAWCIMPNHVHVLVEPKVKLSKIVQSWKSFTGRWAMKHNAELGLSASRFWMHDYWDRYIRDEQHLLFVIDYIHNNPVKAGLCLKETDWLWSSAYMFNASIKNQHME